MSGRHNPFVFVVGCPRSGTTLLQRMLDAHPRLTVANDSHFITRAAKRELRADGDPRMTPALLEQVLGYRRFHRLGLGAEEARRAAQSAERYSEFVSRLYSLRGERLGKPLSGEKTPDYCREIPLLSRLFPAARFVHIVRDGRDTALSTLGWATPTKGPGRWDLWSADPVATCALWWVWQCAQGVAAGRELPGSLYHEVRYERLVAAPETELSSLAAFLGVEDRGEMARFHSGRTIDDPELSAKKAWRPPQVGLRDWRRDMAAEDVSVFEGIAGSWLTRLAYPLADAPRSATAERRIEKALSWWRGDKRSRQVPAPA